MMLSPLCHKLRNGLIYVKIWMCKYRLFIWPIFFSILYEIIFLNYGSKNFTNLSNHHFDILSTNAMLAGFLFTGISIMISVNDKPFIQELKKAGYWREMLNSAYLGIVSNFISICISLVGMVAPGLPLYVINLELLFLIIGITCFVLTISSLRETLSLL